MKVMFSLIMEDDFGQEAFIFSTPAKAKDWARESYNDCMRGIPDAEPFDEYWDDYCYVIDLDVDP